MVRNRAGIPRGGWDMKRGLGKVQDFVGSSLALGTSPLGCLALLWRQTKNLRVHLHLARHNPLRIDTIPTRRGTLYARDNVGDITNLPGLIWRNVYRCEALKTEGVILDVGANVGYLAALASWLNPGRRIYCFEPLPGNADLIRLNCPAAKVFRVALGRQKGSVRLQVDPHAVMASSIETPWQTKEQEFQMMTLDQVAQEEGIPSVAFLKLDTEGMEIEILAGAEGTLRRTARVAMETHSPTLHAESQRLLCEAGLHIDDEFFGGRTGMIYASRPAA